jgi:tetratricopeptide (TPR) repeat protein
MCDEDQSHQLNRDAHERFCAGEHAIAIELYNKSLSIEPNAQALRGLGECYAALGKHGDAIFCFAASAGLRPHPKASLQLAESLLKCGYLDEARRAAERAVDAMPHYKAAHEILAHIKQRIVEDHEFDS